MSVFAKMNLKDQDPILVLDAPASFEPELQALEDVTVHRAAGRLKAVGFFLAFVTSQPEVDAAVRVAAERTSGDAIVWFAYPKGTSKRYRSTINRDTGWEVLGAAGFEPVRMVAIDEDWSGVRFRRAEFIKSMMRATEHALSATGKAKTRAAAKARRR